ncbi:MAG: hypothetical protein WBE83_00555 [Candidatus Cybelea sp.]
MSPRARYIQDLPRRYAAVSAAQRSGLLDPGGCIALLRGQPRLPRKRRRRSVYGPQVLAALALVWKAGDYPWSARLKATLPHF